MKKVLSGLLVLFLLTYREAVYSQDQAKAAVSDVLSAASGMQLHGYLADRLNNALVNRVLAQDVSRLIEPFKAQNRTEARLWQSEFWGKWFTSAVWAYKYHPDARLKKVLDSAVAGLLATQSADGYIGNYAPDKRLQQWDIWGRKYCMLGLLSYYELTTDKKALTGASRIADNLMADLAKQDGVIVTKGNYKGMAASSVLEPVCLLYKHTGNSKYLSFAKEIVKQWETPEGPQLISKSTTDVAKRFPKPARWYSAEQGQKAYEMMSCYEGLLELYRLTGDETYRKAVENTWDNIRTTEINIAGSGASTEMWFGGNDRQDHPVHHYQETCVTVTWLKLCEQLFRLTGDVKYADEAEKSYYNALLGAMSTNGAVWAKYTPLNGQRLPGSEQCGMGLNCCDASGPRGLFLFPQYMVTKTKNGVQVNNFASGNFKVSSPANQQVNIIQGTDYPLSGKNDMVLQIAKPESFELGIRVPSWSTVTRISVNGEQVNVPGAGRIVTVKRLWKQGDQISLSLDMRARVIEKGYSTAIRRGPIVLTRDSGLEGAGIASVLKPVADKEGYVALEPVTGNRQGYAMLFQASFIPESYTEAPLGPVTIKVCDYASAGNVENLSHFKVWSEQLFNPSKQ